MILKRNEPAATIQTTIFRTRLSNRFSQPVKTSIIATMQLLIVFAMQQTLFLSALIMGTLDNECTFLIPNELIGFDQ